MTTRSAISLHPYRPELADELLELWHRATDGGFPLTREQWLAGTDEDPYFQPEDGQVITFGGRAAAFLIGKRFRGREPGCLGFLTSAWISLLAVTPEYRGYGLGRLLVQSAARRGLAAGADTLHLGGDFYHFAPGLPAPLARSLPFFQRLGFEATGECWDVQRDLEDFDPPAAGAAALAEAGATVEPCRPGREPALLELLRSGGFPPRWHHDAARYLAGGGNPQQFVGLWRAGMPAGFAWIHPPGSPGTRRWRGWQPQITALGPIGVASSHRGKGLGLALLAGALQQLQGLGARQTVIDWTDLLEFYGRLGFQPWIRYNKLRKELQRVP